MNKDPYDWDCIMVRAEINFPHKTETIKGEVRFGEHPVKNDYEFCLKISANDAQKYSRSYYAADDTIWKIVKYDDSTIEMEVPFYVEEYGGYASEILIYKRDFSEYGRRFPETLMICQECYHDHFIDNRPDVRDELLVAYGERFEFCECGKLRMREGFKVSEYEQKERNYFIKNLFKEDQDTRMNFARRIRHNCKKDPEIVGLLIAAAKENKANKEEIKPVLFALLGIELGILKKNQQLVESILKNSEGHLAEELKDLLHQK